MHDDFSVAFQAALIAHDLPSLRRCPKGDLHNHAFGSADRAFLLEKTGRDFAPLDRKLTSMAEMHSWTQATFGALFNDAKGRLLGFEGALVLALKDGVTRIETGEDVWGITLDYGSAADLARAYQDVHKRVAASIEWIPLLGMSRHCSIDAPSRWLAPFLELDVFQSLDLSGDEFAQPIENFRPLYQSAKQKGLRLKAHVGEWGIADDVWRAVEVLELHEVQHGIAAADSPQVMQRLADHHIRLNICPTSNIMLGRVEQLSAHPIRKLYDAGVRVTINTDDALIFGKTVSEEFLGLYDAAVFAPDELDQIRLNGLSD